MKPPPPRLPAAGCVTASANATAIAASTAFPPRFMISTPTRDATSFVDATIPCRARTGSRGAACDTLTNVNTQISSRTILRSLLMAFYPSKIRVKNIRQRPERIELHLNPLHQRPGHRSWLRDRFEMLIPTSRKGLPKLGIVRYDLSILQ